VLSVLCEYEPRTCLGKPSLATLGSRLILAEHRERRSYKNFSHG